MSNNVSGQDILLEVNGLTKRFGPIVAVEDVSFAVSSGEVLGFLGPNGAGKSTTMRLITGFLLRQQIADFKAGQAVSNHVHPDALSEREKDMLIDSLKAIGEFSKKVRSEFTAEIF